MISQDTSAYGVDVKYRTGFWDGRPVQDPHARPVRARSASSPSRYGAWVRLHYVYPYPHVDEILPLMASGPHPAVPRRAVPARPPRRAEAHEAAGQRRDATSSACSAGARSAPSSSIRSTFIAGFPGRDRGRVRAPARLHARGRRSTAPAASPIRRSKARPRTSCPARCRSRVREERRARFMAVAEEVSAAQAAATASARRCRCWSIRRRRSAARAASGAAMPMRPRSTAVVRLLPPEKASQDAEGRRVHARAHRRHRGPRPGRRLPV